MIFIIGREQCVFRIKKPSIYSGFIYCINIPITQRVMWQSEPTRLLRSIASRCVNARSVALFLASCKRARVLRRNECGYSNCSIIGGVTIARAIIVRSLIFELAFAALHAAGGRGTAREQSTCPRRTHNIVFNSSCFNINFNIHAYNYRMGFP